MNALRRSAAALAAGATIFCIGTAAVAGDAEAPWKLRVPAQATVGSETLPTAQFEFACRSGKGGAVSLSAILPAPESVASFPLDAFEGPDGIGESRNLARWSVDGDKSATQAETTISGWRGVDGDGFLLSTAGDAGKPSGIARIAGQLVASDRAKLRLVVHPPEQGEAITVETSISGRREAIAKILAPCLPKK